MNIKDIELTVAGGRQTSKNIITRRPWRLTDGKRHPVTIIRKGVKPYARS